MELKEGVSMSKSKKIKSNCWFKNAVYYMASLFMPSILLFDLYNRNHVESNLFFKQILILAGALGVVGLLLFFLFKLLTRSVERALVVSFIFWIFFWLFETLYEVVLRFTTTMTSTFFLILMIIGISICVVALRRYEPPFEKVRAIFNVFALCIIAMFFFNAVPGVNNEMALARIEDEGAEERNENELFYIKRNFLVEPHLQRPDIYWIHMDGLMSFEMIERFFEVPKDHLRAELEERGFIIYADATLNAGYTSAAYPALLSPAFYDSLWGELLLSAEMKFRRERHAAHREGLSQVGLTFRNLASYYELFGALNAGGFHVHLNTNSHRLPSADQMRFGDLPELLSLTTPFNIYLGSNREVVETRYIEHNSDYEARFVMLFNHYAHMGQLARRVDPSLEVADQTRVDLYPLGVEQAIRDVLREIDGILEVNPDAVIVLQSDHGFHMGDTQRHLLAQGYSEELVLELLHSVFSAVRIPSAYGGLEDSIAPLNITRVLVNRFVGENYELLSTREDE